MLKKLNKNIEPVGSNSWLCFFYICILAIPFFSGCIATQYDMEALKASTDKLNAQIGQMQTNQADLSASMDNVNTNIVALSEKLDDNKNRMSLLAQRMDDIQADLSQRVSILTEKISSATPNITPVPSDMFQVAYADYSNGKYDLAIISFRSYMEQYPGTELASRSQYYLADCYFNKKDFSTSFAEFNRLIADYPQSEFIVSANYKKALCLLELKKTTDAKKILDGIIGKYPDTQEARQAQEKLKSINK